MTTNASTPLVRKLAQQHGVDLGTVKGTGAGGRVTRADVEAAGTWRAELDSAVSRGAVTPGRVPAYEAMAQENPVATVNLLRQLQGPGAPAASRDAAGGLPVMTASGIDPAILGRVPASARPALAAAPTTQDAYAVLQTYEGMDDAEAQERVLLDQRVPASWIGETGVGQ
jgi:pyruvate dehydrogenase E2 component (dihydrolipoamide acetyltransferase)